MPVMNGYKATQEIKKINNNIPILAYSSLDENISRPLAIKNGMNEFISKGNSNLIEIIKLYLYQLH